MHSYDNSEALLRMTTAPRRNQFFYGKRMDVQHFSMEQDYGRLKQCLLNRLTLGKGVVCGLRVVLDDGQVCVDPGVAIDGLGREIVVPVRSGVDPAVTELACRDSPDDAAADPAARSGFFTLWVCYRECNADFQPVLVSDCDTRDSCAAGTTVETFGFKVTPGLAPLQIDPSWCAALRSEGSDPGAPTTPPGTSTPDGFDSGSRGTAGSARDAIDAALASRRHRLCAATGQSCDVSEEDSCVPLAALQLDDGHVVGLENCLVRPRVYSNEMLLDLILCLAERIDQCCEDKPPTGDLLQVTEVTFLRRQPGTADEVAVASVTSPLATTEVRIGGRTNAIRIRFNQPFAQDRHRPSTPGSNDPAFRSHNVVVLPNQVLQEIPYVPGTLAIESPQVVRFDLLTEPPYSRGPALGWQKGRYRLVLAGYHDSDAGRFAITDLAGVALDGEPIVPADGRLSGDSSPGGDFAVTFVVG